MSASMSHGSSAEPDLTPMLDMVFQLVTFFMLVMNFKAASLDMTLKLPVVGSAKPVDTKGQEDLLILNIDPLGHLNVYGMEKKDINAYIAGEAQASLLIARRKNAEIKSGDELPTTVVVRADKSTTFNLLYKVIKICQDHGYRRFALKAMNKAED
jgi:biopolymer transport protein ExbD